MRPIKFKAWDKSIQKMVIVTRLQGERSIFPKYAGTTATKNIIINHLELFQQVGKTDKHGKEIYADSDIFKFKFMKDLDEAIDLVGVFTFNEDDLRYEIDIYSKEHPEYVCKSYVGNGVFYDFEIIGTKQENPELIGAK